MQMIRHAFFSPMYLMIADFPKDSRMKEYRRGMMGAYLYLAAALLSIISVIPAIAILIINPLLYFVPRLISDESKK